MRRAGYDLKISGGLEEFHENTLLERLNLGIKGTSARETGRSEQKLKYSNQAGTTISLRKYALKLDWGRKYLQHKRSRNILSTTGYWVRG